MSTKKRIHKLAVIRHRTRTRLVAALRSALTTASAASRIDHRKNVLMLIANPSAYSRPMDELTTSMHKAISHVAAGDHKKKHK